MRRYSPGLGKEETNGFAPLRMECMHKCRGAAKFLALTITLRNVKNLSGLIMSRLLRIEPSTSRRRASGAEIPLSVALPLPARKRLNDCATCGRAVRIASVCCARSGKLGIIYWVQPIDESPCPCAQDWCWTRWRDDQFNPFKPNLTQQKIAAWNTANPR